MANFFTADPVTLYTLPIAKCKALTGSGTKGLTQSRP